MYSKVLVPLDGSRLAEQIVPYAAVFAQAYGVPIELLKITDPDAREPFWPPSPDKDYLTEYASKLFPPSLRITSVEEQGKPAEVIVDRAKADLACLIAMATHGLSGLRRWFLGSIASKVVQTTRNPLLLVRTVEQDRAPAAVSLRSVLVPLDGSALAEAILPHVIDLARRLALDVHLVRVFALPLDTYVVGDAVYIGDLPERRRAIQEDIVRYLETVAEKLKASGLTRIVTSALEGDSASEIIEVARTTPDSLIAMCTHGRSGPSRWVLGSVSEKVIHGSRDPVLIVRPQ
ncbi:MAG TPA: universal stress protein [Candidatus Eisenbacteria bacterium]|nr:universal stress protein [Candidatus Eisenbacteria bacterium]